MKNLIAIALVAVAAIGLAGCGDNHGSEHSDAHPLTDGGPEFDAPPANDFTTFVHRQILQNTSDTADSVPYASFSSLPDNDLDNPAAYADLF